MQSSDKNKPSTGNKPDNNPISKITCSQKVILILEKKAAPARKVLYQRLNMQ